MRSENSNMLYEFMNELPWQPHLGKISQICTKLVQNFDRMRSTCTFFCSREYVLGVIKFTYGKTSHNYITITLPI